MRSVEELGNIRLFFNKVNLQHQTLYYFVKLHLTDQKLVVTLNNDLARTLTPIGIIMELMLNILYESCKRLICCCVAFLIPVRRYLTAATNRYVAYHIDHIPSPVSSRYCLFKRAKVTVAIFCTCLLYTSDAADD